MPSLIDILNGETAADLLVQGKVHLLANDHLSRQEMVGADIGLATLVRCNRIVTNGPLVDLLYVVSDGTPSGSDADQILAGTITFANGKMGTLVFLDVDRPPEAYGARADSTTDDRLAFNAAEAAAYASQGRVRLAPGKTYALSDDVTPRVGIFCPDPVRRATLRFTSTAVGRRCVRRNGWGNHRILGFSATDANAAVRVRLADQPAGRGFVTCLTPSDASSFAVGDVVVIAAGKSTEDGNDSLWLVQETHRITSVDSTSGVVTLEGLIKRPLKSWGFEPGGKYYDPTSYAAGTSYTVGSVVKHSGHVYEAFSAGTSVGASPITDTMIDWRLIVDEDMTAFFGTNTLDRRPIMGRAITPLSDIRDENIVVENASATTYEMAFDLKNLFRSSFKNIKVKGRFTRLYQISEASNYCDLDINFLSGNATSLAAYATVYAARNIHLTLQHTGSLTGGGLSGSNAVFLENNAEATISGEIRQDGATFDAIPAGIAVIGGSEVKLQNLTMHGFDAPVVIGDTRRGAGGPTYLDPVWMHPGRLVSAHGCSLQMSSQMGISWSMMGAGSAAAYVGNDLRFFNNEAHHPSVVPFRPSRVQIVEMRYPLSTTEVTDEIVLQSDVTQSSPGLTIERQKLLVLGVEATVTGLGHGQVSVVPLLTRLQTSTTYGTELVTGGDFSNGSPDLAAWTIGGGVTSATVTNGVLRVVSSGTGTTMVSRSFSVDTTKTYQLSYKWARVSGSGLVRVGTAAAQSTIWQDFQPGQKTIRFKPDVFTIYISVGHGSAGAETAIDDISLREVMGASVTPTDRYLFGDAKADNTMVLSPVNVVARKCETLAHQPKSRLVLGETGDRLKFLVTTDGIAHSSTVFPSGCEVIVRFQCLVDDNIQGEHSDL